MHQVKPGRPVKMGMFSRLVLSASLLGASVLAAMGIGSAPNRVRAWEGGQRRASDPDFVPRGRGPNAEAELADGGLEALRRRHRHLVDNSPLVDGAMDTVVENTVGSAGIVLHADTGDEDLNRQIDAAFEMLSVRVDVERAMTLAEHQALFVRELLAGDVGVNQVVGAQVRLPSGRVIPRGPAMELIDSERMPVGLSGTDPGTGNAVRQSVEYDGQGRVIAYHVLVNHPQDGGRLAIGSGRMGWPLGVAGLAGTAASPGAPGVLRIPAEQMSLAFVSRRVLQLRGMPRTASAVSTLRTEGNYVDDTMMTASVANALGCFFETSNPELFAPKDGQPSPLMVDASGNPLMSIRGPSVGFLPTGTKFNALVPNVPGQQFAPTSSALLTRIAKALRLSYAAFTGDTSKSNFSSERSDGLRERLSFRVLQEMVIRHHTEPFRRRCIDWAVAAGMITLSAEQIAQAARDPDFLYRHGARKPGWEYVNPSQEAAAVRSDLEVGVKSHIQVIGERGADWRQVVRDRIRFAKFVREEMEREGVTDEDLMRCTPMAGFGAGAGDGAEPDGDEGGQPSDGGRAGAGGAAGAAGGARGIRRHVPATSKHKDSSHA